MRVCLFGLENLEENCVLSLAAKPPREFIIRSCLLLSPNICVCVECRLECVYVCVCVLGVCVSACLFVLVGFDGNSKRKFRPTANGIASFFISTCV